MIRSFKPTAVDLAKQTFDGSKPSIALEPIAGEALERHAFGGSIRRARRFFLTHQYGKFVLSSLLDRTLIENATLLIKQLCQ